MTERDFAIDVVRTLRSAGFQALFAGGCVRDELLGLHPKDYDVATDARPEQVMKLFRRAITVGASFGVVEVIGPRDASGRPLSVEVATFRRDGPYSDGRRPDTVEYTTNPAEDARRRDFTINGMFFDPLRNCLHDYVGGQPDLQARLLRAIGDPFKRFSEDKLRILRAARIASHFELTIEPDTLDAAQRLASRIGIVSAERVAEEFRKMLTHPHRTRGMVLLRDLDLVPPLLPELIPTFNQTVRLNTGHHIPLWDHSLNVLAILRGPTWPKSHDVTFPLAFAALLHDIGLCDVESSNLSPSQGHERVSRNVAWQIAERLKLSNFEKDRIAWLVENHEILKDAPTMRLSRLKPLLADPGIGELLALHRTDAEAHGWGMDHIFFCEKMLETMPAEELNPPPLVSGEDLKALGLKPGPQFGRLLAAIREAQLEGRARTKEDAITLAQSLISLSSPRANDGSSSPPAGLA